MHLCRSGNEMVGVGCHALMQWFMDHLNVCISLLLHVYCGRLCEYLISFNRSCHSITLPLFPTFWNRERIQTGLHVHVLPQCTASTFDFLFEHLNWQVTSMSSSCTISLPYSFSVIFFRYTISLIYPLKCANWARYIVSFRQCSYSIMYKLMFIFNCIYIRAVV